MRRSWAVLLVVAVALASCGAGPRLPVPPTPSAPHRVYVPLAASTSKRGLGVTNGTCAPGVRTSWHYDWSARPRACFGSAPVPMIYCVQYTDMARLTPGQLVFALNEPDRPADCSLSPQAAAVWWYEAFEIKWPNVRPIGPAISHAGEGWLTEWHAEYIRLYGHQPPMWAINAHCYGGAAFCRTWLEKNIRLAEQWTKSGQVWLTEWAALPCWVGGREAAYREAETLRAWLEAEPGIAGYAWFATYIAGNEVWAFKPGDACNTSVVDAAGQLTTWGRWYAGQ